MKRRVTIRGGRVAAFALALTVAAAGCGDSNNNGGGSTAATGDSGSGSGKKISVALLIPNQNDYATSFKVGAEEAASEDGNASVRTFVAEFNPQKQVSQCQDAIQSGSYQALVIEPVDGVSMISCVKRAVQEGIKVVGINAPLGPDFATAEPQVEGMTAALLSPPADMGKVAADLTAKACGNKNPCKVGYLYGVKAFGYDSTRKKATDAALKKHPNIKLVIDGESQFDRAKTISAVNDMLQAAPDMDVLLSVQDPVPVVQALKAAGKSPKLIATGASEAAVKTVTDGDTEAMQILMPKTEAKKGTEIAIKAARGEQPSRKAWDTPHTLSPVGDYLTAGNADKFPSQFKGA